MDTINCWNKPPSLTQGRYACQQAPYQGTCSKCVFFGA